MHLPYLVNQNAHQNVLSSLKEGMSPGRLFSQYVSWPNAFVTFLFNKHPQMMKSNTEEPRNSAFQGTSCFHALLREMP